MDLVRGRYAARGFTGDRSGAEVSLASKLYGVLRWADVDDVRWEGCIYAYITKACESHRETDKGEPRKWGVRDGRCRRSVIHRAISRFELERWERWQRKRGRPYQHTGDYSPTTRECVLNALWEAYDDGAGYPSKGTVVDVAQAIDSSRARRTHDNALRKLRRDYGQANLAKLDATTWVYYPTSIPDPENATSVRYKGEEYDPSG